MKCPACGQTVKDSDEQCACGETLGPWRTISWYGHALRQRGLTLAGRRDYLGAALSFLEAALTNPLDEQSLIDAARALVPLGKTEEALRLVQHAGSSSGTGDSAAAVAQAIQGRVDRGLLALGPVPRSGRWLGKWRRAEAGGDLWTTVLRMEQNWSGDWCVLAPWLREAVRESKGQALFQYMLGLGHWQREDRTAAMTCFERCLLEDPPVLNPAAYYLCVNLDDPAAARAAHARLHRMYGNKKLDDCLARLEEKLAWSDPQMYDNLRTLLDGRG